MEETITDPVECARRAGLHYVSDDGPGIRRRRAGKHFTYLAPDGTRVRDEETLLRIRALAIPPAYREVWICPNPLGHIQVTARDARGRKQYRYHVRWRETRDAGKHTRMVAFGQALPLIRRQTDKHLRLPGLPRQKVLAAVVRLLEATLIRIGNEEYARQNESYGLTTLRPEHARVEGCSIHFAFRGKSGVNFQLRVQDRRLSRVVKQCNELCQNALFCYPDGRGNVCTVTSADVNAYLREISGQSISAKDFRTWSATVLAAMALAEAPAPSTKVATRKAQLRAVEKVAARLGNTPAVCRKSYIHPAILQAYETATLPALSVPPGAPAVRDVNDLTPEEAAVLSFLQQKLESDSLAA